MWLVFRELDPSQSVSRHRVRSWHPPQAPTSQGHLWSSTASDFTGGAGGPRTAARTHPIHLSFDSCELALIDPVADPAVLETQLQSAPSC